MTDGRLESQKTAGTDPTAAAALDVLQADSRPQIKSDKKEGNEVSRRADGNIESDGAADRSNLIGMLPAERSFMIAQSPLLGMTKSFYDVSEGPLKGKISKPEREQAKPGTVRWYLESGRSLPADQLGKEPSPPGGDVPALGKVECKPHPAYLALIDTALRNYYDPAQFGDIEKLKNKYNCEVKTAEDAIHYAHEALKVVDDGFTGIMTPPEVAAFKLAKEGKDRSVGVQLEEVSKSNGRGVDFKVKYVEPGSAAEVAGIKQGDIITHVNDVSTRQRTLNEVNGLINASDSTKLGIKVLRDGKPLTINFEHEEKEVELVKSVRIKGTDIVYLRLDSFGDARTAEKMKDELKKYKDASGFILDIRDNPGGLLDQALSTASLFMKEGLVTTVRRREDSDPAKPVYSETNIHLTEKGFVASNSREKPAPNADVSPRMKDMVDKPTIVLVNEYTGSSAEIFAAALQQNGDAKLVGSKTFGKGVGQTIFMDVAAGAAVKATTFRYYTPNGSWLGDGLKKANGIVPDTEEFNLADVSYGAPTDIQFQTALAQMKLEVKGK